MMTSDSIAGAPRRSSQGAPLRIGIAGLGTVGAGVLRLLAVNGEAIAKRAGRPIAVSAVCARDRKRDRGVALEGIAWEDDMTALAARADVDVIVELVGGADGPALATARAALAAGKPLVTANKAMVAHHGLELATLAAETGAALRFEAAVTGAIPIVNGIVAGAVGNQVQRVYGILNGTCNFVLSQMEQSGRGFADVLTQAQALGFAEADPTFDIEGVDAAHKLAILSSLCFGTRLAFDAVERTGISRIEAADIAQAKALGHVIRLIGVADRRPGKEGEAGALFQRVAPYLVPAGHPLASVTGATNAVVLETDQAGRLLFEGAGAGGGPTASAVMADIVDIARGNRTEPFGIPVAELQSSQPADAGSREGRAYMRFTVADRPGVLAEITAAMRDAGVSIESMIQHGEPKGSDGGHALVAMVSHKGPERAIAKAIAALDGAASMAAPPLVLRLLSKPTP